MARVTAVPRVRIAAPAAPAGRSAGWRSRSEATTSAPAGPGLVARWKMSAQSSLKAVQSSSRAVPAEPEETTAMQAGAPSKGSVRSTPKTAHYWKSKAVHSMSKMADSTSKAVRPKVHSEPREVSGSRGLEVQSMAVRSPRAATSTPGACSAAGVRSGWCCPAPSRCASAAVVGPGRWRCGSEPAGARSSASRHTGPRRRRWRRWHRRMR